MLSESPAGALLALLLDAAARSLFLFLVAGAELFLLRRAPAALRHLVCLLLAGTLLALPLLSAVVPRWPLPLLPRQATETTGASLAPEEWRESAVPPPVTAGSDSPAGDTFRRSVSWPEALLLLWLGGTALLAGRMLGALLSLGRLARGCAAVTEGRLRAATDHAAQLLEVRRPVTLLRAGSDGPDVPMTWGLLRPAVLLPASAPDWPEARLRAVLLHEMAHVRRGDWASQLVAGAACALYWFNPLVWWLAARLRAEGELACDDRVLLAGVRASDYADTLLEEVRGMRTVPAGADAAVSMARTPRVESRLRAILDSRRSRRTSRACTVLALAACGCLVAPAAGVRLVHGASAPPPLLAAEAAPPAQARVESAPPAAPPEARTSAKERDASVPTLIRLPLRLARDADDAAPLGEPGGDRAVAWGPGARGLQLGIRMAEARERYAPGETVRLETLVRNAGSQTTTFSFSGRPAIGLATSRWTLQPGETALLDRPTLRLNGERSRGGHYQVSHTYRLRPTGAAPVEITTGRLRVEVVGQQPPAPPKAPPTALRPPAPLPGTADALSMRRDLEEKMAHLELDLRFYDQRLSQAKARYEAGVGPVGEVEEASLRKAHVELDIQSVRRRMRELASAPARGDVPQAARDLSLLQGALEINRLRAAREVAQAQLARLEALFQRGSAGRAELEEARARLAEADAQVALAERRLKEAR